MVTGVEVYFVYNGLMPERGNIIQLGRRSCAKDYIFDFEHENFLHLDFADCEKSEYLSYVILNIDHLDRMADFYDFAHRVAGHLPPSQKTSLRLYDDLMLLYSMEQMENAELLSYAGRMLTSLGDMLAGGNENQHFVSIYHKFLKKYAAAISATQAQIPNDIFKRLVNQYDNALDEGKELIRTVMSANIENCSQLDANEQLFDYMSIAGFNQPLYKQLIEEKLLQRPEIFDTYLKHMFSQKRTVHSLFEYVDGLITSIPSLLDNEGFKAMLHEKSIDLYAASGDRYIALKYLEDKCKFYQEKYPALAAVFSEIYVTCLTQFMKSLSISSFSTDHILDFSLEEVASLDMEAQTKYNTILALKEILMLTTDQTMAFIHYDAFGFDGLAEKLSPDPEQAKKAEKEIKMKLWSAMGEKKSASKRCVYPVLLYASETNENGSMNYDFERVFPLY